MIEYKRLAGQKRIKYYSVQLHGKYEDKLWILNI